MRQSRAAARTTRRRPDVFTRTSARVTQGLRIRPADIADTETIAALGALTFHETFAEYNTAEDMAAYLDSAFALDVVRAELADPANTFFLTFLNDDPDACAYLKLREGEPESCIRGPDPFELHRLYVARRALGRGVGAALMRLALETARERGHRTLWLAVWEHNERAKAFYERWGFEYVGAHSFWVGSDEQTDLVMERSVSDSA